jgi:hypothetical protein
MSGAVRERVENVKAVLQLKVLPSMPATYRQVDYPMDNASGDALLE